jgi:hypothetical protein
MYPFARYIGDTLLCVFFLPVALPTNRVASNPYHRLILPLYHNIFGKGSRIDFLLMNYNSAFSEFLTSFKDQSEKHFAALELDKDAYGLQHQKGTRWRPGLTEQALCDFQREVGFEFPAELLAFYRVMNGTDLPGINIYGQSGLPYTYAPIYFSYPEHLPQIKQVIAERLSIKGLTVSKLKEEGIPLIFPINDFYFMIIDDQTNPVYFLTPAYKNHDIAQAYVYGSLWTDSLQSWLIKDIFHRTDHLPDLEEFPARRRIPTYWTTEDEE